MKDIEIRAARSDDFEEILDVCSVSLGWRNPQLDRALFRWKHIANPFGPSLIMVALAQGRVVAVRPFMRWRFRKGDLTRTAARAVDTATHPDARGKGLFRTLTESGIEVLRDESVDFIFNTPNDQSRPGYLKMGWVEAERVPVGFRLRSPLAAVNLRGARVAAEKISTPLTLGVAVSDGLAQGAGQTDAQNNTHWATDYDVATLRWRFVDGPIEYRWIPGPQNSGVIARVRQRGSASELLVATTVGSADSSARSAALKTALKKTRADYCLAPAGFPGTVTTSKLGPLLTVRNVLTQPEPQAHHWEPGDLELF